MVGKHLKEIIKDSGITVPELSKKSEIPVQTIYSLYRKTKVEKHFLEKLKGAGLPIELEQASEQKGNPKNNYMQERLMSMLQQALDNNTRLTGMLEAKIFQNEIPSKARSVSKTGS